MKILPSKNRIVMKAIEHTTKSGFVLPVEQERQRPEKGEVIAIGKGTLPIPIKVGDTVFYEKYSDFTIDIFGEDRYIFVHFDKILGKLENEENTNEEASV